MQFTSPAKATPARKRRGLLWWLPPSVAAFIYTVLLKPAPLRKLAQRIICRFIPDEIQVRGVSLVLNPADAIVSGSLALGCYESYNQVLFESLLRPGMTVIDVGANIGLFSAIAASYLGESGRVIAVEPDATNCSFIKKTIQRNQFNNLVVVEKAAGDQCKTVRLYLCENNKADHRVYDPSGSRSYHEVEMTSLDELVRAQGLESVDLMKIDAQGAEPLIFDGMRELISKNPRVKILVEFWPWGILQLGRSPRQLLDFFQAEGFAICEVNSDAQRLVPVTDLDSLVRRDLERQHTNLFLERL
ncbi:FkbM family methyltransferase [bacterium]|nr:FkbM family methyltransferase [bacterium]